MKSLLVLVLSIFCLNALPVVAKSDKKTKASPPASAQIDSKPVVNKSQTLKKANLGKLEGVKPKSVSR